MAKPRVMVLRAPGTNCDQETAFAFEQAGAQAAVLCAALAHPDKEDVQTETRAALALFSGADR